MSYTLSNMEKELTLLKRKYKTYRKLAEALEVTERHIWRVAHGYKPSKSLEYRIKQEAARI